MTAFRLERLCDERALWIGEIADGPRQAEDIAVNAEMDRRFIVRRRDENASRRIDLQSEHRRRIEVVVEDERLVLLVMALQILDEPGRPRPLPLQPFHLVRGAVRVLKNPVRIAGEIVEVSRLRVCKAANGDAAHAVCAFGVVVFPGDVVARARRQDVDVVALREPFRRQAARVFRSAENLRPVSLNDESDPHVVIMCMLAFAVCVSHFPVILGSGPTVWSGGKSPESRATRIASSMWILCRATRACCSTAIDAPLKVTGSIGESCRDAARCGCRRRHPVQRKFQSLDRYSGTPRDREAPPRAGAGASSSRCTTGISRGCSGLPIGSDCGRGRPSSRSSRRQISSSSRGSADSSSFACGRSHTCPGISSDSVRC